jgi:putative oxidoreductase
VQRLFSTFPNGWPGRALLILRLIAAAPLLLDSIGFLTGGGPSSPLASELAGIASAVFIVLGFCTPLAALLQAGLEIWLAIHAGGLFGDHAILASIGISLSMLGPGAWSIDAYLFGRRRIELPPPPD